MSTEPVAPAADPQIPSSPAAPGPGHSLVRSAYALIGFIVTVIVIATAAVTAALVVQRQAEEERELLRAQFEAQSRQNEVMFRKQLAALENIATPPPTNDKLFQILSQGVGVTEDVIKHDVVGTTPTAAFATDLTSTQQTAAYTQEIVIMNTEQMTSGTKNLCFKAIAWSVAGGTCALKCAGQTITCTGSGTSTDGIPLLPGQSASRRYDGTSCICVVGSAASTDFFSERVLR